MTDAPARSTRRDLDLARTIRNVGHLDVDQFGQFFQLCLPPIAQFKGRARMADLEPGYLLVERPDGFEDAVGLSRSQR